MVRLAGLAAFALVAASAAGLWWHFASPLSKTALLQAKLDNGTPKFFSMPRDFRGAVNNFEKMGVKLYAVEESDHCIFHRFETPKTVYILSDDSWRQGTICMVRAGDKVGEVYWLFQPGAP